MENKNVMLEAFAPLKLFEGDKIEIINASYNPYEVTYKGLIDRDGRLSETVTTRVLNGAVGWRKLPWVPKMDERYYSVTETGEVEHGCFNNDYIDHALMYCGNCFRTEKEAEAHKDEIMKKLGMGAKG